MIKAVIIGGTGAMLSPASQHLKDNNAIKVTKVLDRPSSTNLYKDARKQAWVEYGAQLVNKIEELLAEPVDIIMLCAGKNGDDFHIINELIANLDYQATIIHFSTVSADFVCKAQKYCSKHHINYVNYPLTGGPKGAQNANMLIICSGAKEIFEQSKFWLTKIGNPIYLGDSISKAAEFKLTNHIQVFYGLIGVCGTAALLGSNIHNKDLVEYLDNLTTGAGGTRQWDVALSLGLKQDRWNAGFMLIHAIVDIVYVIDFAVSKRLSKLVVLPLVLLLRSFIFAYEKYQDETVATHIIYKELACFSENLDDFILQHFTSDFDKFWQATLALLPYKLKSKVMLELSF